MVYFSRIEVELVGECINLRWGDNAFRFFFVLWVRFVKLFDLFRFVSYTDQKKKNIFFVLLLIIFFKLYQQTDLKSPELQYYIII